VDDEISFGTEVGNFGAGDFTVEFWIQAANPDVWAILGKREHCNHGSFWEVRGTAFFLDQNDQGLNYNIVSPSPLNPTDGRWHHLAYVRADTNAYIYLDGKVAATMASPGVTMISNAAPLLAGNNPCVAFRDSTRRFKGLLDEIKIYDMALTPRQVAAAAARSAPTVFRATTPKLLVESSPTSGRFMWRIDPEAGHAFTTEDISGLDLESSLDMKIWTIIPAPRGLITEGSRLSILKRSQSARAFIVSPFVTRCRTTARAV
jgi:hypothetical protein